MKLVTDVELNIALTVEGGDNSNEALLARHGAALCWLTEHHDGPIAHQVCASRYAGLEEIVLVASLPRARLIPLVEAADYLCAVLGQPVIALYIPGQGEGALLGPASADWGEFDLTYFHRYTTMH